MGEDIAADCLRGRAVTALTFRNPGGRELQIGEGRLKFLEATGLEAPQVGVSISKGPGLDGAIGVTARMEPRHIEIRALLDLEDLDEASVAEERKSIGEAMAATEGYGILTVSRVGRTRQILAMPSGAPDFAKKRWDEGWQRLTLGFVCGQPCFKDMEPVVHEIRFYTSLTEFDEEGMEIGEEGIEFSSILATGNRMTTIVNHGNQPAPVRIRFTGPIVNPFIRNITTGEMLRISRIIMDGEYLEIDTEPGKRTLHLYQNGIKHNGMHYLDLASKFWKLVQGENVIEIGDESPGEGSEAFFEFHGRYLEA